MALTEAKIQDHIGRIMFLFQNIRNFASVNAENFIENWRDVGKQIDYPGDFEFGAQDRSALDGTRAQFDAAFRTGSAVAAPTFLEYGQFLGFPERNIPQIFRRLRTHFVDNSLSIKARNFTFGTPTADGGNVGDGDILRMTKDEDGVDLENQWAELKTAICVRDENSGTPKHEEVFELRGTTREIDSLVLDGSGRSEEVKALSAADSLLFIQNPSFEFFTGTLVAPTAINGWELTTGLIAALEIDETDTYRSYEGDGGVRRSLKFDSGGSTTVRLKQKFSLQGASFEPTIPYFCQLAFNRQVGSGDGNLELKLGSKVSIVVLGAQTGWNRLSIPMATGQTWYRQFNEGTLDVEIELSGRSTGSVLVDDVVIGPMSNFAGGHYAIVGGETPFLVDDEHTWTDSVSSEGIIAYFLWRWFNEYVRQDASPTWLDPA